MMEAAIKQDLDHRLMLPHKVIPPDSSAGVSLSGITEPRSASITTRASLESLACQSKLVQSEGSSQTGFSRNDEVESTFSFSRASHFDQQAKILDFDTMPTVAPSSNKARDMVLHFERANNSLKQDIIQVSEIFDTIHEQPSWQALLELLGQNNSLGINFHADTNIMIFEHKIVVGCQRQLSACLKYLCNIDKLNAHCLVYDRDEIDQASSSTETDFEEPANTPAHCR